MQICCGFAYTSEGVVVPLNAAPRVKVVKEIVDAADGKCIVFTPFIESVRLLYDAMCEDASLTVFKVYGDTPKAQRDEILHKFQHTKGRQVIVAHPQCMAHGLTLTEANTIVWYTSPLSLEIYEQANGRITRPGQVRNTHIIQLQSSKLEEKFYKTLERRGAVQADLLEMFQEGVDM